MIQTRLIVAVALLTACTTPGDTARDTTTAAAAVGHRVQVNGMQLYYEVSGAGDPLIVLHGAYMNIPSMGAIIPKLAETHKVYAVEFRGTAGPPTSIAPSPTRTSPTTWPPS